MSVKLQQSHYEQLYHHRSKDYSHNYSIVTITDDRLEIQVISRMITLNASCSLTTIRTHRSVSLYCKSKTHLL